MRLFTSLAAASLLVSVGAFATESVEVVVPVVATSEIVMAEVVVQPVVVPAIVAVETSTKNSVSVSGGINDNTDVKTIDVFYERTADIFESDFIDTGLFARAGNMSVDNESSTRLGLGGIIHFNAPEFMRGQQVKFSIPFGMVWLDKHDFGNTNYGGQWQFTTGLEAAYTIHKSFDVFYRFEHMSNAGIYNHNPGLDTHNVGLRFTF